MRRRLARLGVASTVWICLLAACAAQAAERTDKTFAGGGLIETRLTKAVDTGREAPNIWDLASHGHGFVGALADLTSSRNTFRVVRYSHSGRLDRSFGDDGFTEPLPLRRRMQAQGIAVQRDGRIVVAGFSAGGRQTPLLARYRRDGSLDRSFGRGGIVHLPHLRHGGGVPHDVAIQPGGRIVVVGTISESGIGTNGIRSAGFVAAYRADGEVDRSFGNVGRVYFDLPRPEGDYSGLKNVAALPDGRLLVSGFQGGKLFMAKLLPDGRLDPGFGNGDGTIVMSVLPPGGCYDVCWQAAPFEVRPDGRIIIVVSAFPYAPRLLRLRPDGEPDRGFGQRGRVKLPGGELGFSAFDVALQRDRIVIAGWDERKRGDSELSFAVFRYRADGTLDRGFGRDGRVVQPRGEFSGAFAALPQSHGRVVVAGGGSRKGRGGEYRRSFLLLTRYLPGS